MAGKKISQDLIDNLCKANFVEVFPQDLRDNVRAARLAYFSLFEEFKNALLVVQYFDEVFTFNYSFFYNQITLKSTERLQALDPYKKEMMTTILDEVFSLRDRFVSSMSNPEFFSTKTFNGVKVKESIDGDDEEELECELSVDEQLSKIDALLTASNNGKVIDKKADEFEDVDQNNNEGGDEASAHKRKHVKKKKIKKRSKRGGASKNKNNHDDEAGEKEKWTGRKEVVPFKKQIVKVNGKFITWPFAAVDEEKLHLDYGENRNVMMRICKRMEKLYEAIIDILEMDFYKSRDHVFKGLADVFGRIADPLNVSDGDMDKLKAIIELVSSLQPREDYSNYGGHHNHAPPPPQDDDEGVIIEDITDTLNEKNDTVVEDVTEEEVGDDAGAEHTSCTCPCHGPCPCCCSGCYMISHKDLVEENNGQIVKIVKKGFGIGPKKPKTSDDILTGPRFEEILENHTAVDEQFEEKKKKTVFCLRETRNTSQLKAGASENEFLKKTLDENDTTEQQNQSHGSALDVELEKDVPTASVEDELEAIKNVNTDSNMDNTTVAAESFSKNIRESESAGVDAEATNIENSVAGVTCVTEENKNKEIPKSVEVKENGCFESDDNCSHCCCHCGCNHSFNIDMPSVDDPEKFAISFLEELKRFSPANRAHAFDMASKIAAQQSQHTFKQKVVEVGMHYFLKSLKELKLGFHLYVIELLFKILMSNSCARKYCYRDDDFFPAIARLLGIVDPCHNRDRNQLRGDAAHVLYVSLMGGPREAFERVAQTNAFESMIALLYEDPNNHGDAQSAEDVFSCLMLFTDEWDLFVRKFQDAPLNKLIHRWRRYALEYAAYLPNFIWELETLKKRLLVVKEASRRGRFDVRLPKVFDVERLERHCETACSNPKCFKVNYTDFENKYKKCSKCHLAYYCSRQCQLAHWKTHKKWCIKPDWLIKAEKEAKINEKIDEAIKNIDFSAKLATESEHQHMEQQACV